MKYENVEFYDYQSKPLIFLYLKKENKKKSNAIKFVSLITEVKIILKNFSILLNCLNKAFLKLFFDSKIFK